MFRLFKREEGIMKEVKLNYEYSLSVMEGYTEKLVGSEIDPKLIGVKEYPESWDNGPTVYTRIYRYEYWLVVQEGQPIIVRKGYQFGDFANDKGDWEAYRLLNSLKVDRWLPPEED